MHRKGIFCQPNPPNLLGGLVGIGALWGWLCIICIIVLSLLPQRGAQWNISLLLVVDICMVVSTVSTGPIVTGHTSVTQCHTDTGHDQTMLSLNYVHKWQTLVALHWPTETASLTIENWCTIKHSYHLTGLWMLSPKLLWQARVYWLKQMCI